MQHIINVAPNIDAMIIREEGAPPKFAIWNMKTGFRIDLEGTIPLERLIHLITHRSTSS